MLKIVKDYQKKDEIEVKDEIAMQRLANNLAGKGLEKLHTKDELLAIIKEASLKVNKKREYEIKIEKLIKQILYDSEFNIKDPFLISKISMRLADMTEDVDSTDEDKLKQLATESIKKTVKRLQAEKTLATAISKESQ